MTMGKSFYRSAVGAYQDCQLDEEFKSNCKAMYKVGTVLYNSVLTGECTMVALSSVEKVADVINNLFSVESLTGPALCSGVSGGRVGKSPPHWGHQQDFLIQLSRTFA